MTKAALTVAAISLLLSACGGAAAPASRAVPASAATSIKPAASAAASAKPAASGSAAASAVPIPAPKPGTITVAVVGGSPSFTPFYVGVDSGLFDKYGAPIQLVLMQGAPPAMAAILTGEVQVAMEGGALVGADITGQKLAFIGALQNGFNQFYVKPNIKSLADLKGKTLAVGSPASSATVAFETMVKSAGLNPKTDVKWIYAGTPAAEWAALSNNQVDGATLVWPYYLQAKQQGFVAIGDGKEMKIPGASLTVGVQREWVKNNPKLVDGLLRALSESVSLANNDKDKVIAATRKHFDVSDQAQLDDVWTRFSGTFPSPPYITREAVEEAITDDPNPGNKQRKPEDFIDNAPLDALVASGFTKQFEKK
jgi:NitT/TauT family transport system substrate-binding protein